MHSKKQNKYYNVDLPVVRRLQDMEMASFAGRRGDKERARERAREEEGRREQRMVVLSSLFSLLQFMREHKGDLGCKTITEVTLTVIKHLMSQLEGANAYLYLAKGKLFFSRRHHSEE